jgi:hypothetical protein
MVDAATRYRPNTPRVLQETLDDETIIVDLDSGSYYSLRGSGCYAWRLLESGADQAAVVGELARFYGADAPDVAGAVEALIGELVGERLVVPLEQAEVPVTDEAAPPTTSAYEPPALTKFTDMQELLLLDPVHDVDETGWPAAR